MYGIPFCIRRSCNRNLVQRIRTLAVYGALVIMSGSLCVAPDRCRFIPVGKRGQGNGIHSRKEPPANTANVSSDPTLALVGVSR